jgi:hypothetical protein
MSDDDDSIPGRAPLKSRSNKIAKMGAVKFTKNTKAFKHLQTLFDNNEITPTDKPNDVRSTNPLFMQFSNQQFRSQFNKLKNKFGVCTKEGKSSQPAQ